MNAWFFPAGIITAILVGLWFPDIGDRLYRWGPIPWLVATIFLVYGLKVKIDRSLLNRRLLAAFFVGGSISLLAAPLLGWLMAYWLQLPLALMAGLLVMSAMPPTMSSGVVITEVAGGNTLWALLLTIGLNMAGVLTIPFVLAALLSSGESITISPLVMLSRLVYMVLLPFLGGLLIARIAGLKSQSGFFNTIPSLCIILAVWLLVSASHDSLRGIEWQSLARVTIAALGLRLALLLTAYLGKRPLQLNAADSIALVFVSSQKTLPTAISVIAMIELPIGVALVPCLVFHFLQLMVDSALAPYCRKNADSGGGD